MVPISAHALFARPMVVSPRSVLAVEVIGGAAARRTRPDLSSGREAPGAVCGAMGGVWSIWPPGRGSRSGAAPAGAAGPAGRRRRRMATETGAPFTDRLVAKFGLPVTGWRGRPASAWQARRRQLDRDRGEGRTAMLEEVRITGLGVIDDAVLELSAGFTVVTGETGAGKTMVVTGLGLLFGGRADPARVRPGAERAAWKAGCCIDAGQHGGAAGRARRAASSTTRAAR